MGAPDKDGHMTARLVDSGEILTLKEKAFIVGMVVFAVVTVSVAYVLRGV